MEFREWFCLKDRDSFIIDPKINDGDARFYFGRSVERGNIERQLRHSFVTRGVPKMILIGAYGSGKTQMLYYIRHFLIQTPPDSLKLKARPVVLNIEMKSKSDHHDFHLQLLEAIGKQVVTDWVSAIARKGMNLEHELTRIFEDANLVEALTKLNVGGIDHTAWRWLAGQQLTVKELEQLRVTRNLGQIGSGDMVRELVGIGKLAELMGEKLIFLMDEAERFAEIRSPDASSFLEDYFRELAENNNSSVGFVVAATARGIEDAAFLANQAVIQRIGRQNIVLIPPIPSLDDVKLFIKQMLSHLVDQNKAEQMVKDGKLGMPIEIYPFEANAFDIFCETASQDVEKALPRNIINGINECAIAAWDKKQKFIDDQIAQDIASLVFE